MMCSTCSTSVAYCSTERQLRSVWTTTFATLRWTNSSPGFRSTISLAGTRLSEQPIHRYLGACCSRQRPEEVGIGADDAARPPAVVLEEICDARHAGQ